MVDTPTKVADVIVPERFNPYFREATTRVNVFFRAGIIATVPDLSFSDVGGVSIAMPFWKALGERAQLLDDDDDLAIKKIQSGQDFAVQHARALVYGATDLSAALAGDDPLRAIGDGVAENWSYEFNMMLIATLKGAMGKLAAEAPSVNTLDISALSGAAAYIDGESFIDAGQTMGDAKAKILGMAMHSATESWLRKNDLIEDVPDSEGKATMPFFQGKAVHIDDALEPASGGVYTTYLFGPGAIGFGEGSPKVPSETDREALKGGGQEYLVTRRHFALHPRGIKWVGTSVKQTPSDAELATVGNWSRVYDSKNIRIVRFVHKIG